MARAEGPSQHWGHLGVPLRFIPQDIFLYQQASG